MLLIKYPALFLLLAFFFLSASSYAKDYYISTSGSGNSASKEIPAKDLGDILSKLQSGDTIHLAGGIYTGLNDKGQDKIEVPVKIIGGYDPSFQTRDPWGKYPTIFSGKNSSPQFDSRARLLIELHLRYQPRPAQENFVLIDGIIIDNAQRNRYTADGNQIIRRASPSDKKRETPQTPGIKITGAPNTKITVQNCVILNVASATGAVHVAGHKNNQIKLYNNLIINNTASGIHASTVFHINKQKITPQELATLPAFEISHNTILFSWQFGPQDPFGGEALKVEDNVHVTASFNVFGFSDTFGVDNIRKARFLKLHDNLFFANLNSDYREGNSLFKIDNIPLNTPFISSDSVRNLSKAVSISLPKNWATLYLTRGPFQDTQKKDTASLSNWNDILAIFGYSKTTKRPIKPKPIWLPLLNQPAALFLGNTYFHSQYGCKKPES